MHVSILGRADYTPQPPAVARLSVDEERVELRRIDALKTLKNTYLGA